jgi:hypothetical protein
MATKTTKAVNLDFAGRNKHIVVIQAGWVAMGYIAWDEAKEVLRIEDADVIRTWGTTKGLGEIALSGPTKSTVLDPAGVIEVLKAAVIMTIPCVF